MAASAASQGSAKLPMSLNSDDIEAARRVFEEAAHHHAPSSLVQYDGGEDGGFILLSDVKDCLEKLSGVCPSQSVLYDVIKLAACQDMAVFDFAIFCRIHVEHNYLLQEERDRRMHDQDDGILAWVTMGGKEDKSGQIDIGKLRKLAVDFELTIDVDALHREVDLDQSGEVSFDEFMHMISRASPNPQRSS